MLDSGFIPMLPSLLATNNVPLIHRDLSWLQFNERVLDEARAEQNPLLERSKFLAISSTNLDEFFMIRVPSLERAVGARLRALDVPGARRSRRVRNAVLEAVAKFHTRQEETLDEIVSQLVAHRIFVHRPGKLSGDAHKIGQRVFLEKVLPHLPPAESFQPQDVVRLENLQTAVVLSGNLWIRIPRSIPTLYLEPGPHRVGFYAFFLDSLFSQFLSESLGGKFHIGFLRLTRDGDVAIDVEIADTESIPDRVVTYLGKREKGRPIRLQYSGFLDRRLIGGLLARLNLSSLCAFEAPGTMYLHGLWSLVNGIAGDGHPKGLAGLFYPPLQARFPKVFDEPVKLFEKIRERDFLLHHPYDSFDGFVKWIEVSADDPQVESIELTIYRMDSLSPVIPHLKRAAQTKSVRVIIELRARFDELNNIRLADELSKARIEVSYGFGKLKLHAKVTLVTRKEKGEVVRYTHLSTGNYNARTARQYTDLAILTANREIGEDARHFIDAIWEGRTPSSFKQLLVAPTRLSRRLQTLIENEAAAAKRGEKARIVAKVNALVDDGIVESLYRASQAGVQIDLIVRGACSVIPGVKGVSENIRVISIVDRFLEHSRLYYFEASAKMYFSSADWMPRNFFSRLEIAFPILDFRVYSYLEKVVIPAYLGDVAKARELTPQGNWKRRARPGITNAPRAQAFFREMAHREYRGTPLE